MKLHIINPLSTFFLSVIIFTALYSALSVCCTNEKTYVDSKYEVVYGGSKILKVDGNTFIGVKSFRRLTAKEQSILLEKRRISEIQKEKERKERGEERDKERKERYEKRDKERKERYEEREKERKERYEEREKERKERDEERDMERRQREEGRKRDQRKRNAERAQREIERAKLRAGRQLRRARTSRNDDLDNVIRMKYAPKIRKTLNNIGTEASIYL